MWARQAAWTDVQPSTGRYVCVTLTRCTCAAACSSLQRTPLLESTQQRPVLMLMLLLMLLMDQSALAGRLCQLRAALHVNSLVTVSPSRQQNVPGRNVPSMLMYRL